MVSSRHIEGHGNDKLKAIHYQTSFHHMIHAERDFIDPYEVSYAYVMNHVICSSGKPVSGFGWQKTCCKNFSVGHSTQTVQTNLSIPAMLVLL